MNPPTRRDDVPMTERTTEIRMPSSVWWLVAIAAVVIVATGIRAVPAAEDDLTGRASAALNDADLAIDVTFQGRDAILSGVVSDPEDVDRAETLVANVRGVRTVDLSGVTVMAVDVAASWFAVAFDGTTLIISGVVNEPAIRNAIVAAAESTFASAAVVSELTVNATAGELEPADVVAELFEGLAGWRSGLLAVAPDRIGIDGVVDSSAIGEQIAGQLAIVTGLDVDYAFDVIGNRIPTFVAIVEGDAITLSGELPDQDDVDLVLASTSAFAVVENNLVLAAVQQAPWVEVLPEFIRSLNRWTSWSAQISGGDGTFAGNGPSSMEVSRVRRDVLPHLGVAWNDSGAEVEPTALAAELTETVAGTVRFETASAILDQESTHVLDLVVASLLNNPSTRVVVEGHTDSQGSEDTNLRLSQARAEAVVAYMVAAGISPDRLTAVGFGETRPIAENGTSIGRDQNRRIEFVADAAEQGDQ